MAHVESFAPIAGANARVLILGSMPGRASLEAGQYYAHAQNLFWEILAEHTGVARHAPYAQRVRGLRDAGIALWDVLASCHREGSLDAAIDEASMVANDFAAFYRKHPRIAQVFFNGAKTEAAYRKQVLPGLSPGVGPENYLRLPSTSPANASLSRPYKLKVWRDTLRKALASANGL